MLLPDENRSELEDASDAWFAFFTVFFVAFIIAAVMLWQHYSVYWSLGAAFLFAVTIGWIACQFRAMRRAISAIAQGLWDAIALFS